MFIVALSTIAKVWKEPKFLSTDEWIKKMWSVCVCVCVCVYTYIHNGVLLSNQKELNLAICSYVYELEGTMLSEISQRKTNII